MPRQRARAPSPEQLAPDFPQLEILALIGEGGMGCVYRARHKQLGRDVALKILAAGVEDDALFEERFLREARALARLDHPGIVRVHDFGRAGTRWFLTMEFVDGVNLRQLMGDKRITAPDALAIVPQICDALQYAHDEGVVHRDIKPENVLIDAKGRVKIADFGLAKIVGPAIDALGGTRTDQVMGTPHYMAPEQATRSRDVDHRADIYSLGVVFYELLTGELPIGRFEAPSKHVQVDVRLDEIVLRSLERTPELRYQHAIDVRTDLDTIAATPADAPSGTRRDAPSAAGAALDEKDAPRRTVARSAAWIVGTLALWIVYWCFFDQGLASLALLAVSVLTVAFAGAQVAAPGRALRMPLAVLVHLAGCTAFVIDRIHRWETSTADYFAQHTFTNWIGFGAQRARAMTAEMFDSGSYSAQQVSSTHRGWWPLFEYDVLAFIAVALWCASAAILFAGPARWSWRALGRPTLLLVGVSCGAAWLAVERGIVAPLQRQTELWDRVDIELPLDHIARSFEEFADDSKWGTRFECEWRMSDKSSRYSVGRAKLIAVEDESPFRRWSFHPLFGPRRLVPRVAVTIVETGRFASRVEWHLGWIANDQTERAAEWRKLGAEIAACLARK